MNESEVLARAELRFKLGVLSRQDIELIFGVGPHTIAAWIRRGLAPFRPGTSKDWYAVADVAAFLAAKPSFRGSEKPDRRPRKKTVAARSDRAGSGTGTAAK